MKATHTDYLHPRHLRVEDGIEYDAYSPIHGFYKRSAFCMAPSHSQYSKLNRKDLPAWKGNK